MLTLRGVRHGYPGPGGFELGPLDLSGPADRPWLLAGPTGSGKSTLLRILAGDLVPREGSVEGARPAAYLPQFAERVFGGRNLAEELTGDPRPGSAVREALRAALRDVGLGGIPLSRRSTSLSAGERRRAALALLRLSPARGWALDEPDAGLDAEGHRGLIRFLTAHAPRPLCIVTRCPRIF